MQVRALPVVLNPWVAGMDVVPKCFGYGNMVNFGIYWQRILSDFNQQILIQYNESTFGSIYLGMFFTLEYEEGIEISMRSASFVGGSALTTMNSITQYGNLSGTVVFANTGFNADDGFQSKRFTVIHGVKLKEWYVGTSPQF